MSAGLAMNKGHGRFVPFVNYNRQEDEALCERKAVEINGKKHYVYQVHAASTGEVVFEGTKGQIKRWAKKNGLIKGKGREGFEAHLSTPADLRAAFKHGGYLKSPAKALKGYPRAVKNAMKVVGQSALGRTTNGRPGPALEAYYVPMWAGQTRAKEVELSGNVFIFARGRAKNGKTYRIHDRALSGCQTPMQARWNLELGRIARARRILAFPGETGFTAYGFQAHTAGAQRVNAAAGANAGPGARQAAALRTRPPKPTEFTWKEAVKNLKYTVYGAVDKVAAGLARKIDVGIQKRLAISAVKKACLYHADGGMPRFNETNVYSTASFIGVGLNPDIVDWAYKRVMAQPSNQGLAVVHTMPTGHRMLSSMQQVSWEQSVVGKIEKAQAEQVGLSRKQIARHLASLNLGTSDYVAVQAVAGKTGTVITKDGKAVRNAILAYKQAGRDVHVIGQGERSVSVWLEQTKKVGHRKAWWAALRQKGLFSGELLETAGAIKRMRPKNALRRGGLLVINPDGHADMKAVDAALKLAAKRGVKVVVTGPSAQQYQALMQEHGQQQQQAQKVRMHP